MLTAAYQQVNKQILSLRQYAQAKGYLLGYNRAALLCISQPHLTNEELLALACQWFDLPFQAYYQLDKICWDEDMVQNISKDFFLNTDFFAAHNAMVKDLKAQWLLAEPLEPAQAGAWSEAPADSRSEAPEEELPEVPTEEQAAAFVASTWKIQPPDTTVKRDAYVCMLEFEVDPLKFLTELPERAKKAIADLHFNKPALSLPELVRTPAETFVKSFLTVKQNYAKGTLTELEVFTLVADYCKFVQIPFPKLVFKQLFTEVCKSFPGFTRKDQTLIKKPKRKRPAYSIATYFISGYQDQCVEELWKRMQQYSPDYLLVYHTIFVAAAHKFVQLECEGKILPMSEAEFCQQENTNFVEPDKYLSCWLDLGACVPEYIEVVESWISDRKKALAAEVDDAQTDPQRRRQIQICFKAAWERKIQSEMSCQEQYRRIFKNKRLTVAQKFALAETMLQCHLDSCEHYGKGFTEIYDITILIHQDDDPVEFDLTTVFLAGRAKKIFNAWLLEYNSAHQDKANWSALGKYAVKVMSLDESISIATKEFDSQAADATT